MKKTPLLPKERTLEYRAARARGWVPEYKWCVEMSRCGIDPHKSWVKPRHVKKNPHLYE